MSDKVSELPITEVGRDQIFLLFALGECARALEALERVEALAGQRTYDAARQLELREFVSVFDAIRMALHFTGSVSRIFFPICRGGKFERTSAMARARAERLRELTGISANHPIRERALRDDVEHIDERLDKWIGGPRRPFGNVENIVHTDLHEMTRNAVERMSGFIFYEESGEVSIFDNRTSIAEWRQSLVEVQECISSGFAAMRREAEAEGRQTLT